MKKVYRQVGMEERTMIQTQLEMGFNPAAFRWVDAFALDHYA